MGNFASSAICFGDDTINTRISPLSALPIKMKTTDSDMTVSIETKTPSTISSFFRAMIKSFAAFYNETATAFSGASVVISDIEEAWYQELMAEVDSIRSRRVAQCAAATEEGEELVYSQFLGPSDTVVACINQSKFPSYPIKTWSTTKAASHEDDDTASFTTEETDDESKCDFTDSEGESDSEDEGYDIHEHDDACCARPKEVEYYAEDDDAVTKAERLLRLASLGSASSQIPDVYVDDYLCPCGECPQYQRIACDVQAIVTWRSVKEQSSIIRVLQAFSTYNEVIGYHPEMIEAAEECLQVWLGDEDRALNSLVMIYDEVPQLCADAA